MKALHIWPFPFLPDHHIFLSYLLFNFFISCSNFHLFDLKNVTQDNCEWTQPSSFSAIQLDFWVLTETIPQANGLFKASKFLKWQQDVQHCLSILGHPLPHAPSSGHTLSLCSGLSLQETSFLFQGTSFKCVSSYHFPCLKAAENSSLHWSTKSKFLKSRTYLPLHPHPLCPHIPVKPEFERSRPAPGSLTPFSSHISFHSLVCHVFLVLLGEHLYSFCSVQVWTALRRLPASLLLLKT